MRTIVWWSAGAASAVAAHVALRERPDTIIAYCDTSKSEHPDNTRFRRECERWYGKEITVLRSDKYEDTWDVYARTRYLVGPSGARCTTELKKLVRRAFERPGDIQCFGFTAEERQRAREFMDNNPECDARFPLINFELSKADCLATLRKAGIELPVMYKLGYRNNNCLGCVKGGMGYWNKVRVDFPEVFARMAGVERELGVSINRYGKTVDGKRTSIRVFLDELPPDAGNYEAEEEVQCGVACEAAARSA